MPIVSKQTAPTAEPIFEPAPVSQAVALALLFVAFVYVALRFWRWYAFPYSFLDLWTLLTLAFLVFEHWNTRGRVGAKPVASTGLRVITLIPTYREPLEIVLPAIAAACRLPLSIETWVLDDGARSEIQGVAESLGARYVARAEHAHAKAGNLNHALAQILEMGTAELIVVVDADHVLNREFLKKTLGYFEDPTVALVQTVQKFHNRGSFEHEGEWTDECHFHELTQPGKDFWGAAFWSGTGAVLRVEALREIGGVACESVTEDLLTSIRLQNRNWKCVFHNEALSSGLGADTILQYEIQRFRWAFGMLQILCTKENPVLAGRLAVPQRLAYLGSALYRFDCWRLLVFFLLPLFAVFSRRVEGAAQAWAYAMTPSILFFGLQLALAAHLQRRLARPFTAAVFEVIKLRVALLAFVALVGRRAREFVATPKGRSGALRTRIPASPFLYVLGIANGVSAMALIADHSNLVAAFWAGFNTILISAAIARIQSKRFAAERRSSFHFIVRLQAKLGDETCVTSNLSVSGAKLELPMRGSRVLPYEGERRPLQIRFADGGCVCLQGVVKRLAPGKADVVELGLEFEAGQLAEKAALIRQLFA